MDPLNVWSRGLAGAGGGVSPAPFGESTAAPADLNAPPPSAPPAGWVQAQLLGLQAELGVLAAPARVPEQLAFQDAMALPQVPILPPAPPALPPPLPAPVPPALAAPPPLPPSPPPAWPADEPGLAVPLATPAGGAGSLWTWLLPNSRPTTPLSPYVAPPSGVSPTALSAPRPVSPGELQRDIPLRSTPQPERVPTPRSQPLARLTWHPSPVRPPVRPPVRLVTPVQPTRPARPHPHESRYNWFISQHRGNYNPAEDVPGRDNANCGPVAIAMAAKAFGKIAPNASQADAAIEATRRLMGESQNERTDTSMEGLLRGARAFGLSARSMGGMTVAKVQAELANGRLVIAHVCPIYLVAGTTDGHFTVVTAIKGNRVYLNDPAHREGPMVITTAQLQEAMTRAGSFTVMCVGA